jgi:hypothetical protein
VYEELHVTHIDRFLTVDMTIIDRFINCRLPSAEHRRF